MDTDELNAPLGQHKKPKKMPKLPVGGPQLVAGALGVFGLVVVGWAALVNDPLGGEPVAVVAAKFTRSPGNDAQGDGREHARYDGPAPGKKVDAAAVSRGVPLRDIFLDGVPVRSIGSQRRACVAV